MKIAVAGVGYVGLVTAVTLADIGHDVICLDIDKNKLKMLNEGVSPIYEYGLEELMLKNRERLTFTDDVTRYAEAQVIIIGVGTPEKEDGSADLGAVFAVADSVADNCSDETVVVVKSTVPIGTCESVRRRISERRPGLRFYVVSNPEFLSQGTAVRDTFNADRIVVGADDEQAFGIVERMYAPLELPIVRVGVRSSEMIKYASNDFLALKISYINEIANFCEIVGADIEEVAQGMGMDRRIGSKFLNAGIGYGGSCCDFHLFKKQAGTFIAIAVFPPIVLFMQNAAKPHTFYMQSAESKKKMRKTLDFFPEVWYNSYQTDR